MEEKLFKIALEYITKYSIKTYSVTIYAHDDAWGDRVKLQGRSEENTKVLESLEFVFDIESNWHEYSDKGVNITITED